MKCLRSTELYILPPSQYCTYVYTITLFNDMIWLSFAETIFKQRTLFWLNQDIYQSWFWSNAAYYTRPIFTVAREATATALIHWTAYKTSPTNLGPEYNCRLYHLDHWTLPDGPSTFLLNDRPLIDNGGRIGNYYENRCKSKWLFRMAISLTFFCG